MEKVWDGVNDLTSGETTKMQLTLVIKHDINRHESPVTVIIYTVECICAENVTLSLWALHPQTYNHRVTMRKKSDTFKLRDIL